jgi:hypothetical protein
MRNGSEQGNLSAPVYFVVEAQLLNEAKHDFRYDGLSNLWGSHADSAGLENGPCKVAFAPAPTDLSAIAKENLSNDCCSRINRRFADVQV